MKLRKITGIIPVALLLCSTTCAAQTFNIDFAKPQPVYTDSLGYGYDVIAKSDDPGAPFFYSVKVPDGNYRVCVTLGDRRCPGETTVRAESRRLMAENVATRKGEYKTLEFIVNKRNPQINAKERVRLKEREKSYLNWDNRLTLEFNGTAPAVKSITIEPDTTAVTLFLCGNSTVVDQAHEPYGSWGQMITRWFGTGVSISNHAESGLAAGSFLAGKRLDKITTMMKPGDYVFVEFGHNDQKDRSPGSGAWYSYQYYLKKFVDIVRRNGATIVFVTPTQRRRWDESRTHIVETHGDFPDAMRDVARRENVPLIELHDMTRTFFETLGYENSTKALVHYPANTFPGQTEALEDNTHFNPYGAYEVAKMVVMGMKELNLPFVTLLRNDWQDFNPAQPDNFNSFKWVPSPVRDLTKPDGN